ncbi:MAG: hypothetical protein QM651_08605 [Rhodoblastus sp.]
MIANRRPLLQNWWTDRILARAGQQVERISNPSDAATRRRTPGSGHE